MNISPYIKEPITQKKQTNNIFKYIVIILIILNSGCVTILYNDFIFFRIAYSVIILFTILHLNNINFLFEKRILKSYIFLIVLSIQSLISYFDNHIYHGSVLIIFYLFFIICITKLMDFQEFKKIFTNIMIFVSTISLICFFFNDYIITHQNYFKVLYTSENVKYINLYFYCINVFVPHRNCGIFWEPGAYQVFLNLAVIFTLFDKNIQKKTIKLLILIATIITTISTTGYIVLLLTLIGFIFTTNIKNRNKTILAIICVLLIGVSFELPTIIKSFSYKFGLENGILSENLTSRINPFLLDIYIMADHPFGIKSVDYYAEVLSKYKYIYSLDYHSSSCTHTIIGVSFGIIIGLAFIYYLLKLTKLINEKIITRIFLFLSIIFMFSTESFLIYPLYYLLVFYGLRESSPNLCVKYLGHQSSS